MRATRQPFRGVFADRLSAYLELRRAMGFHFETEAFLLKAFDKYVNQRGYQGPLTQELALAFATENPHSSINYRVSRYKVVRHFSEYLATFNPQTPVLDPKALRYSRTRTPAYIFTDKELIRLLDEAKKLLPPVRGITIHAMVGLAASTGLRISEVIKLDKADVELDTGIMTIRKSKFNKSRLVSIHPTTLGVMRNCAAVRDTTYPDCSSPAFFVNRRRRKFSRNTLQVIFCKLAQKAGLRGPRGRGPSFHSIRHTFAVKRLVSWYKNGMDVQAMLPALATYLGHVHYSDTAYYLKATPELLNLAAERYHGWALSRKVRP